MVVGPLLSIVKAKASSYLLDKYKVMEGMEEQHRILKRKLRAILDVIADAEEAASHRDGAKAWLEEVKRVAYEANEIFDEFKYEALRREAKKNGHYNRLGFDVIKLFPSPNRFAFREKMGKKLCRIVQAIEVLVTEMNAFGFKYQQQGPASKQWRQTDHVTFDPKKIISRSRDQDTKKIVDTLLGQAGSSDLTAVPIVGIGGLGKTTLAQLIYNEPEIQKHFELLIWVCVSDNFYAYSLARKITEFDTTKGTAEAPSKKGPLDIIQDVVSGHRYLLVLDDVWNRELDKWEKVKARLTHGAKGSVVLTTTRDEGVAKIMGSVKTYNLAALEDNFLKEIIETRAFSLQKEGQRPAVLVDMVGEIVKRCCGSPLAATALGSLLRTKTSEEEWKAISSISNICTEESGILPILKLSYNDLSSEMKQCFAFCAVFPKDYVIDVLQLIQLWIAHGFIKDRKDVSPETTGKQIFSELVSRSFFVDVKQAQAPLMEMKHMRDSYSKHTCKIHDLMHDVALSVMENECALSPEEPSPIEWFPDSARHLFLSCQYPETILNDALAKRSPAIQTLLCDHYMKDPLQHLSRYNSLKALRLRTWSGSFPLKSKYLHHLRYLDLSRSFIEALPEDISILYNLQTLDVSGCSQLRRLPRQMKYMTALRHLYTHGCPSMTSMPGDLQKLVSLRTLTCFVSGPVSSGCSDVGELEQLNLGGQLELRGLHNVTEKDAKADNLGNKKELQELTLEWGTGNKDDAKALAGLKPHDGLQTIKIKSYGSTTFPTWMTMWRNMAEIHIINCGKLQWLFSCDTSFTFPNLKEFTLKGMECLEKWWEISSKDQGEQTMFPQLEKLSIVGCAKLTALPEAALLGESHGTMERSAFPVLKELKLKNLQSFQRWETIEGTQRGYIIFPNLVELKIKECPMLTTLPEAPSCGNYSMPRSAFPALKFLKLQHLRSFERLGAVEGSHGEEIMFPQLEKLCVIGCGNMIAISPKLSVLDMQGSEEDMFVWLARHMTSLTNLKLLNTTSVAADQCLKQVVDIMGKGNHNENFPLTNMELTLFKSGVTKLCACFVQLQSLCISSCDALVHWPEKEFQSLVYLRRLEITSCCYLVGYAQAPALEPSTTSASSSQLLPRLESLKVVNCDNMVEVFKLPASLKQIEIRHCPKLKSIFCRRLLQGLSASLNHQGTSPVYSKVSSASAVARTEHSLFPCLESVRIERCDSLTGVLDLPSSLKVIFVGGCGQLVSVGSQSGEMPLSWENLFIMDCKTLSSLPDGPQAYPSLQKLIILNCPGIKRLPTCMQQRLSSVKETVLDARLEEPRLSNPLTWRNAIRRH